jgi:hypothetical protein
MMTIIFIMLGLAGVGLVVVATAPVGYQDENGFHFGCEHAMSLEDSGCETRVDRGDQVAVWIPG